MPECPTCGSDEPAWVAFDGDKLLWTRDDDYAFCPDPFHGHGDLRSPDARHDDRDEERARAEDLSDPYTSLFAGIPPGEE